MSLIPVDSDVSSFPVIHSLRKLSILGIRRALESPNLGVRVYPSPSE